MRQPSYSRQQQGSGAATASRAALDDALPALLARLRHHFARVLYKHCIPPEDAEDVVQTALLLAVAKWSEIREPEAWLLSTLHNRCILYWRKRKALSECTRQLEEPDLARGVEPVQRRRDYLADLGRVWHRLSATEQRLLTLRYGAGLSTRETAAAMGLANSSVRKTAQRALERLRRALRTTPALPPAPRQRRLQQPAAIAASEPGAGAWLAAITPFLAASKASALTRRQYRCHLLAAGAALAWRPLAGLSESDVLAFRAALLADGRSDGTHLCVLLAVRCFLAWAGQQGWHAMQGDAVRVALRGWNSRRKEPLGPASRGQAHGASKLPGAAIPLLAAASR